MLRSILYNLISWSVFVVYLLLMYPIVYFSSAETTLRLSYRPLTRWMLFCLKHFAGVGYEIRGKEKVPIGQVIIGCNHQSAWETMVFSLLLDDFAAVVKKELLQKPIAGMFMKRLECIPVDRESPVKAIKTLLKFGKIAYDAGKSILIFPNGTRASADEHVEYKSGVFALYKTLKLPVVPVYVNSGKCWSRNSFRKSPGIITMEFKQPILPGLDKDEFFEQFERNMETERK